MWPGGTPAERRFLEGLVAQYHTSPAEPLRALLDLADLYSPADMAAAFRLAADHNRYQPTPEPRDLMEPDHNSQ